MQKYANLPRKAVALYFLYRILGNVFLWLVFSCMGCVFGLALYINNCKHVNYWNVLYFVIGFLVCALLAILTTWVQILIKPWYNSVYFKITNEYVTEKYGAGNDTAPTQN